MSPKYIRLKIMFPGGTSCRICIEVYLCVQGADHLKKRNKQSDLCSVLKLEAASSLYLFLLLENHPLQNIQDTFQSLVLNTQWAQNRSSGDSEFA